MSDELTNVLKFIRQYSDEVAHLRKELDAYQNQKHLAKQAIEMFCHDSLRESAMKWLESKGVK